MRGLECADEHRRAGVYVCWIEEGCGCGQRAVQQALSSDDEALIESVVHVHGCENVTNQLAEGIIPETKGGTHGGNVKMLGVIDLAGLRLPIGSRMNAPAQVFITCSH